MKIFAQQSDRGKDLRDLSVRRPMLALTSDQGVKQGLENVLKLDLCPNHGR